MCSPVKSAVRNVAFETVAASMSPTQPIIGDIRSLGGKWLAARACGSLPLAAPARWRSRGGVFCLGSYRLPYPGWGNQRYPGDQLAALDLDAGRARCGFADEVHDGAVVAEHHRGELGDPTFVGDFPEPAHQLASD